MSAPVFLQQGDLDAPDATAVDDLRDDERRILSGTVAAGYYLDAIVFAHSALKDRIEGTHPAWAAASYHWIIRAAIA